MKEKKEVMRGVHKRDKEEEGKIIFPSFEKKNGFPSLGGQFYSKGKWFHTPLQTKQCKIKNKRK